MIIFRRIKTILLIILIIPLLTQSELPCRDSTENIRRYTRNVEFDYIEWTLKAFSQKTSQSAFGVYRFLSAEQRRSIVMNYLKNINTIEQIDSELVAFYSQSKPKEDVFAEDMMNRLQILEEERERSEPLSESILQQQISDELAEQGITFAGQPVPPVLFHITAMPKALIISPRDEIKQTMDISLSPNLTLDEIISIEKQIEQTQNVSALIVDVGGVGTYPTMIMQSDDLNWLVEVIAHEWTHNYLTLHPLGLHYFSSPELRTMNETIANLSGKEIASQIIRKYYPDLSPTQPVNTQPAESMPSEVSSGQDNPFDFRAEMHLTRVQVDEYLSEGKIDEAEAYMESRRLFFQENGISIRKLNQAYFAFHGAYADEPGGASGKDPVGPDVIRLRNQYDNLADFLNAVSKMSSYEDLKKALEQFPDAS